VAWPWWLLKKIAPGSWKPSQQAYVPGAFRRGAFYSYLGQVRRFAAWYEQTCGEFDPGVVMQLDVAEYRRWMQGRGCRSATVNLALVALGRFFSWAVEEGICSFNPAAGVKRVPE